MKKNARICAAVLAVVMLFCCMPFGVFAKDNAITVSFSAFDGEIIIPKQNMKVSDGEAEKFGYVMPEEDHNGEKITTVTAFDVLVAAHEAYYGSAFTPETAENYLVLLKGEIRLAFGQKATTSSFAVNNDCLHDGIIDELYGTYTGYGSAEARINSGDYMAYFFYQDTPWCMDYYAWFTDGNTKLTSVNAVKPMEMTLTLEGYTYGWYSCNNDEDKDIAPLCGVDVYLVKNGEYMSIGKTDENGQITVSIKDKGDYQLCAYGIAETDYDDVPVSAAWCDVKVQTRAQASWQKIVDFFNGIFAAIAKLFGR